MSEEEAGRLLHIDPDSIQASRGIGLLNTNRRLMQHYGKGLHIESKLGQGTVMSFVIPNPSSEPGRNPEFFDE